MKFVEELLWKKLVQFKLSKQSKINQLVSTHL